MFKKRFFLILIYLVFQSIILHSQDVKFSSKYASPANMNKGIINNSVVSTNLYTGELFVNIPLFEFKTKSSIYPLNLGYSANGVKVNDYSDEIGIKWSTNIGGSIIRIVKGIPDENSNGYLSSNIVKQNLNGVYTSKYFDDVSEGKFDSEPDEFIINIFGKSYSFYLDQSGSPYFKDNCNFKMNKNGILDEGWVFIDDFGSKYYFGMNESTRETEQVYENSNSTPKNEYINKWHLESIKDINSNDLVSLEYYEGYSYDKTYYFKNKLSVNQWDQCAIAVNTNIVDANVTIRNVAPKYLSKILSENNKLELRYVAGDRLDIQSCVRLDKIVLLNSKGTILNSCKFNQIFTDSRGINDLITNSFYKRMVLNSVSKYDSENNLLDIISFVYDSQKLPELNSDKTDHWGYFNNKIGDIENGDKTSDINFSKAGILKEIVSSNNWGYSFEYENHDYNENESTIILGGLRIKQISSKNESKINVKTYKYTVDVTSNVSSGIRNKLMPIYKYGYTLRLCTPYSTYVPFIICWAFCTKYANHSIDNLYSKEGIVGYSNVYEIQEGYGYTQYKFTSNVDYPDEFDFSSYKEEAIYSNSQNKFIYTNNVLFENIITTTDAPINSPTSNGSLRGFLKELNIYNNNSVILSKSIYNYEAYNIQDGNLNGMNIVTKDLDINKNQNLPFQMQINPGSKYHVAKYNINSKNLRVTSFINIEYYDNKPFEYKTDYYYENPTHNYVTKEVFTAGLNKQKIIKYRYVNDILIGGQPFVGDDCFKGIFKLISENAKKNLVEKTTYLIENGNQIVLNSELFTYKLIGEKVFNSDNYIIEGGKEIQNFIEYNFSSTSPHISFKDNRYISLNSNFKYDPNGRIIQFTNEQGINLSYKYNNSDKKIAEFINASTNINYIGDECSFVSFESNSSSNLNVINYEEDLWQNIESNNFSNIPHTGHYSYTMKSVNNRNEVVNYGPTKNFLPTNQKQKYKFSAWVKTPSVDNFKFGELVIYTISDNENLNCYPLPNTINNESYKVLNIYNTNSKWKYIELTIDLDLIKNLSGVNNNLLIRCFVSNTNNSHNFLIDDVSFQPIESQSISYSYDNIFGNIYSIINYDKKVVYKVYNSNGGEFYSKDQNGNILDLKLHSNDNKKSIIYETLVGGITDPNKLISESLPISQYKKHVYFKDGVGNLIQENIVRFSPTNKDLIVNYYYDNNGLPSKNYLPYTVNSNNGNTFRANFVNELNSFYSSNIVADETTNYPFGEVVFDNSPLKNIIEVSSPGDIWRLQNKHTKKCVKFINSINEIRKFSLVNNSIILNNSYNEGDLICVKNIDEQNNEIFIFYDKLNTKICEKKAISANEYSYTYFIYDENSRLICSISPMGFAEISQMNNITLSSNFIKKWCQYYNYDSKGRVALSQVSNVEPQYYVYNKLGKIALMQDPNLREQGKWVFYKYDILGRVIMKGIKYLDPALYNYQSLQNLYNNFNLTQSYETSQTNGIVGYSNNSFPYHSENDLFYVSYYEKCFNIILNSINYSNSPFVFSQKTIEMSKNIQEDYSNSPWFKTYYSYDENRNIEMVLKEVDGGYTIKYNTFDFNGNLISEKDVLNISQFTNEFTESYTFDNYSRLKSISCKLNNNPSLVLSNYFYNEVGNNIKKNYNIIDNKPLFSTEFKYSIRNWITELNTYYTEDQTQCESAKLFEENTFKDFLLIESERYPLSYESIEEYITTSQAKIVAILNELGFPDDKFVELLYDDVGSFGDLDKDKFANQFSIIMSESFREHNILNPNENRQLTSNLFINYLEKLIQDKLLSAITYLNCYPVQVINNLFYEKLFFDRLNSKSPTQKIRYDGNATSIYTKILNNTIQVDYDYDYLKQLKNAKYSEMINNVFTLSNKHDLYDINYDLNGNIKTFKQNGALNLQGNNYGLVDFLNYDYVGNKLINVEDNIADNETERNDFSDGITTGFGTGSNAEFIYDKNGNLIFDKNNGITIKYNLLGNPYEYLFTNGNKIEFQYTTNGEKISKKSTVFSNGHGFQTITNYIDKFEYSQGILQSVYLEEGRLVKFGSSYSMEYAVKDHLGNSRLIIKNNNNTPEVVQTLTYTPFGNIIPSLSSITGSTDFGQKFNGKELINDFKLNLYDFGPRNYNPKINRWNSADRSSIKYPSWSGYNFALNDPINLFDPDGNDPDTYTQKEISRSYTQRENEMKARYGEFGEMARLEMWYRDYAKDVEKETNWIYNYSYYEGDGQNSDPSTLYGLFNKVASSFLMFTPFGSAGALFEAGRTQNYYAGAVALLSLGVELGGIASLGTRASESASIASKTDNFAVNSFRGVSSSDNFNINLGEKRGMTIIGEGMKSVNAEAAKGGRELFNFSAISAEHMENPGRAVPIQILEQAINSSMGLPDPRGSRAIMYMTEIMKNGKAYNLEVLYDNATNSIWHFQYSTIIKP